MSLFFVRDGQFLCDSRALVTNVACSYGSPYEGKKSWVVAGGRAIIARCGDMIPTQLVAEKLFAIFAYDILKAGVAARRSPDPLEYTAQISREHNALDEDALKLTKGCGKIDNLVIVTKHMVFSLERSGEPGEREYAICIHSNRHNTRYVSTGSDTNHVKTLVALGLSPREVVEKAIKYSGYVGGEIHHYHADKLVSMPLTRATMAKVLEMAMKKAAMPEEKQCAQ